MAKDKQLILGYIIIALLAINTVLLAGISCKVNKTGSASICPLGAQGSQGMCPYGKKGSSGPQKGSAQ